ncbi:MAG: hypothetical protein ACRDAM_07645, partial [Casimicrobium sp.]
MKIFRSALARLGVVYFAFLSAGFTGTASAQLPIGQRSKVINFTTTSGSYSVQLPVGTPTGTNVTWTVFDPIV